MTTLDESNDPQRAGQEPEAKGGKKRFFVLVGLLALALFALWYDYKVARPAVERAYERIAATNDEINTAAEHRRMSNADVQDVLGRAPSETFTSGVYTVEAYRWAAGMPIEFRGLGGDESPGIGLKTHDYYAVYRKDGPELAFVMHFKFTLDETELSPERAKREAELAAASEGEAPEIAGLDSGADMGAGGMPGGGFGGPGGGGPGGGGPGGGGPGGGGPGGGGPGGGGGFDPEAFFAERDADGDGKWTGEEISERTRAQLEATDTDGDGAVSKEEFLTRIRERRRQGGPGGPGGGPGGPGSADPGAGEGRRQRPPLDSTEGAPAADAASGSAAPSAESPEAPADSAPVEKPSEPAAEAPAETSEAAAKDES